jgi:D-arabinose 1-dehydrogenase-like Zn-dependent alcohol dehydrogenase
VREVAVSEPGPGQVLVKIGGAGACHSDLHLMESPGQNARWHLPFTLGHENAGWVEKLGAGVGGLSRGDPVLVYCIWGCGACGNCRADLESTKKTRLALPTAPDWVTTAAWRSICWSRRLAFYYSCTACIRATPHRWPTPA